MCAYRIEGQTKAQSSFVANLKSHSSTPSRSHADVTDTTSASSSSSFSFSAASNAFKKQDSKKEKEVKKERPPVDTDKFKTLMKQVFNESEHRQMKEV